jgi:filamentous hemagglutinin
VIDERKVRDYLLNPLHARGGHKARMFAAALGHQRADFQDLIVQIRSGILVCQAERIGAIPYGERFRVDVPVAGRDRSALVRTLWIYRMGEDVPRLTSAYPIR